MSKTHMPVQWRKDYSNAVRSLNNSNSSSDSGGSVATTVFGESAARTEVTFLESCGGVENELICRALAPPSSSSLGVFEAASNASTVSGSGMNFFRKFVQGPYLIEDILT